MRRCDYILLLHYVFGSLPIIKTKALTYLAVVEDGITFDKSEVITSIKPILPPKEKD